MKKYNAKIREHCMFLYGNRAGHRQYRIIVAVKLFAAALSIVISVISVLIGNSIKNSVLACTVLVAVSIVVPDWMLKNRVKKKKESIKSGLADFMDRTAILLDAGMTLWRAIAETALRQDKADAFTGEILVAVKSYSGRDGYFCAPEQAMQDMADRCSTVMVSSFVSTVIQNSRKGSEELVFIFRSQAESYRIERRNIAKKRAEEASALMLLPTAMIFIAVIALVTTPALFTVITGVLS